MAQRDFSLNSGERLAVIETALLPPDHMSRYQYVIDDLGTARTSLVGLDAFCGSGYGANMMASALDACILAIDGSSEAIEQANLNLLRPNLFFSQKFFPFHLPPGSFDFVASMESIEHVEDYESFACMLGKSLKPGGRLYVSAPDEREMSLEKINYHWHFKHFLAAEFEGLFTGLGLRLRSAFSTNHTLRKEGKVIATYPYVMRRDSLERTCSDGSTRARR